MVKPKLILTFLALRRFSELFFKSINKLDFLNGIWSVKPQGLVHRILVKTSALRLN